MNFDASQSDHFSVSVVLGRVSTEDSDRVLETISGFQRAFTGRACEIVIADRLQDEVSTRIASEYPDVRLIPCPAGMSLPEMRTRAFEASHGNIVAVTEDHCVPGPDWVNMVVKAFKANGNDLVAVGGSVINGVDDTGLDWATFLCEYSFFYPPVRNGRCDILPGMNIAYRRAVLESAAREKLTTGFWETTLHADLLEQGGRFLSLNSLAMVHKKRFSFGLFAAQRFIYSRYYSGTRFRNAGTPTRIVAIATTLLLPPILLWRIIKAARAKDLRAELMSAFPWLCLLVVIWAVGESLGAMLGPGDALSKIE